MQNNNKVQQQNVSVCVHVPYSYPEFEISRKKIFNRQIGKLVKEKE